MNIRRILWVIAPLISVTCYSAPEWPARLEMLDDGIIKNTLYEPSVQLKNMITTISFKNDENKNIDVVHNNDTQVKIEKEIVENNTDIQSNNKIENPIIEKNDVPVKENKFIEEPKYNSQVIQPKFIMTIGDSLMSEVSQGLRSELNKDIKVKDIHKSSTGLTNIDYYDWPSVAYNNVKQYNPDTVIIHMGGNDGQDMKVGKVFVHIDDPLWKETYMKRAELLINEIKSANNSVNIIWLGLPEMRDNKFSKKMNIIRSAQYEVCKKLDIKYIDGKEALGENYKKQGVFEGKMQNWRRTDGIHYTREGGTVMAYTLKEKLKW